MKLSQFKHWTRSEQGDMPRCILTSYAGCADYLMEVEYKNQLEPLKDDNDKMVTFQSIEQVRELLKPLGISSVTLRVTDPHDECMSTDGQSGSCQQDMTIAL